jgi:hypothetical protein
MANKAEYVIGKLEPWRKDKSMALRDRGWAFGDTTLLCLGCLEGIEWRKMK